MSDNDYGNCDGTFKTVRYFHCRPNHGIFIPAKEIKRVIKRQELLEKLVILQMQQQRIATENNEILQRFSSKKLAWHYNQITKKWDIVYKMAMSNTNENSWIVKDCNEKQYVVDEENLYNTPPSDELSLTQTIELTMNALSQSMSIDLSTMNVASVCVFVLTW